MLKRFLLLGLLTGLPVSAAPRISQLPFIGPPALIAIEKDVLSAAVELDPGLASQAGLPDEAGRVPSFAPAQVARLKARLSYDLEKLRILDWQTLSTDEQIDARWTYANAELILRQIEVERVYLHRPAAWLEATANNLISLLTYSPDRLDIQAQVLEGIPAMLTELEQVCSQPTRRDLDTARGVVEGLLVICRDRDSTDTRLLNARRQAATALEAYQRQLQSLQSDQEYQVIGPENYAWRYDHALLLEQNPQELMATAYSELKRVDQRLSELPAPPPQSATAREEQLARDLTQQSLLALYDEIEVHHRQALEKSGVVSLGTDVGPIHARPTPEAMIPLTGDGGSMNPPPPFGQSNVGYWNVEHFRPDWDEKQRLRQVQSATRYLDNGMGPYSAHEGVPGHHLQLSRVRLNRDPVRTLLPDSVMMEGWALYSEEMFWQTGGLGSGAEAERSMLQSYRSRIKRVVYDVMVETGQWNLQQGADFRHQISPGKIDEDLLRTIQWPTQLVCYFAGKQQILKLRQDCRQAWGSHYSDRRFHDELLAVGSIPLVLVRAKVLGQPVPKLPVPQADSSCSPGVLDMITASVPPHPADWQ